MRVREEEEGGGRARSGGAHCFRRCADVHLESSTTLIRLHLRNNGIHFRDAEYEVCL